MGARGFVSLARGSWVQAERAPNRQVPDDNEPMGPDPVLVFVVVLGLSIPDMLFSRLARVHAVAASEMEWARQSCRAWGGRLARHRRYFHRFRVPEPGMKTASKIAVCRANGNLTPGPSPQAERGEPQQFLAARESPFASPLPVREGCPRSGRGRAVAFSSFQSAGARHDASFETCCVQTIFLGAAHLTPACESMSLWRMSCVTKRAAPMRPGTVSSHVK